MFNGFIKQTGLVNKIIYNQQTITITIKVNATFLSKIDIGSSVAVNGVCTTVIAVSANTFSIDISKETLTITTFSTIHKNDMVNLEHPITLSESIDGHLVTGHVDSVGEVINIKKLAEHCLLSIRIDKLIDRFVVSKCSIAVNGISLTVNNVANYIIELNIIPHTLQSTNLKHLSQGDKVNIETDIMAKHLAKLINK